MALAYDKRSSALLRVAVRWRLVAQPGGLTLGFALRRVLFYFVHLV